MEFQDHHRIFKGYKSDSLMTCTLYIMVRLTCPHDPLQELWNALANQILITCFFLHTYSVEYNKLQGRPFYYMQLYVAAGEPLQQDMGWSVPILNFRLTSYMIFGIFYIGFTSKRYILHIFGYRKIIWGSRIFRSYRIS